MAQRSQGEDKDERNSKKPKVADKEPAFRISLNRGRRFPFRGNVPIINIKIYLKSGKTRRRTRSPLVGQKYHSAFLNLALCRNAASVFFLKELGLSPSE
jgi:hypothetical protein